MRDFAIRVDSGPSSGRRFRARSGSITIGRVSGNDVVLTDPGVSRRHLRLRASGVYVLAEDLGSANGTFVEERRMQRAALRGGEKIRVGGTVLHVEGAGAPRRPDRRALVAAVTACLVAIAAAAALHARGQPSTGAALSAADGADVVRGNGPDVDVSGPVRLGFPDPPARSFALLRFTCNRVEREGMVEVRVDGAPLGLVPRSMEGWRSVETAIPAALLHPGRDHEVSFAARGDGIWEVSAVSVTAEPLPACEPAACAAEAATMEERGRRQYEARAIAAGNLLDAYSKLSKARLLLAAVRPEPPLASENRELMAKVLAALDELCGRLRFTATRDFALGDGDAAAADARAILAEFPSGDHACRRAGQHMLEVLGEAP